jgi:DNA-binding MarR family transcriptional regulator
MSNYSKIELITAIGRQVQTSQEATDEVDEQVARVLGLNRTDLRCLSALSRHAAITAGALAETTGLTRGAMTTALDRLEAAGYARRVWNETDRRSVRVELTDGARRAELALFGPLAQDGVDFLQKFTLAELAAILRYLEEGTRLQRLHAERLRSMPKRSETASAPRRTRRTRR